jgi:hypothetical protein
MALSKRPFEKRIGIQIEPMIRLLEALSAYGHLSMRKSRDLDILVHEKQFLSAREFLISSGFRCSRLDVFSLLFDTPHTISRKVQPASV